MTTRMGRPYFRANSKSRPSGPGPAVLPRDREVALVVPGHGHDRARAVAGEDEVADPDRDALAAERIRGMAAGEHAFLLHLARLSGPAVLPAQALDGLSRRPLVLGAAHELLATRGLPGDGHERGPQ